MSEDATGFALPDLDKRVSYDMAGLANVAVIDVDASWALSDALRKRLSCHSGAVRLYWPSLQLNEDPFRHPLWTRQRLGIGNPVDVTNMFRRQLRGVVMRAAALGVVKPREIDQIRDWAKNRAFAEMKAKAASLEDYVALAESYAAESARNRESSEELQTQLDQQQARILALESERAALLLRVENAEVQLRYRETAAAPQEIEPVADKESDETEPRSDEIRFYKKSYSAPTHDVMRRVADCGCSSWQTSHAADKARKGVAKLEGGREDWKVMQHCGSCTGGGMWRVKW